MPPLLPKNPAVTLQQLIGPGSPLDDLVKKQQDERNKTSLVPTKTVKRGKKAKPYLSIKVRRELCESCPLKTGDICDDHYCLELVVCSNPACKARFTHEQYMELWECYDRECPTCKCTRGSVYICPACNQPQPGYDTIVLCPNDPGGKEVIEALQKELKDESTARVPSDG